MFDIGWTELLVIAVVAVIIVGPKDLPRMLRTLGRYAGKLKRTAGEFRSQFDEAIRDSELDDLRSTMSDLNPVNQIKDGVTDSLNPLKDTADEIKGGIQESASGSAPGRMKTDATSGKAGSGKAAAKPAAKKKSSAARPTGKSAAAKKPAARKKAASTKSATSRSAAAKAGS
jgi:sec-independent protein translocase protein TatB